MMGTDTVHCVDSNEEEVLLVTLYTVTVVGSRKTDINDTV